MVPRSLDTPPSRDHLFIRGCQYLSEIFPIIKRPQTEPHHEHVALSCKQNLFWLPCCLNAKAKPLEGVPKSERRSGDSVHGNVQCSDRESPWLYNHPLPWGFYLLPKVIHALLSCFCWNYSRITGVFLSHRCFLNKIGNDCFRSQWINVILDSLQDIGLSILMPSVRLAGADCWTPCTCTFLRRTGSGVVEGGGLVRLGTPLSEEQVPFLGKLVSQQIVVKKG